MILYQATWPEVDEAPRSAVVLIPTGSLEQHGPHLPLFTDSLIVTAVAEAVEKRLGEQIILCPTLWLGASGHHLRFPGSLSSDFEAYISQIESIAECLMPHGFRKFYVLNGHGGNADPNGIAARKLKARHPNSTIGQSGYFAYCADEISGCLEGPWKDMRHACEAETSLMMHLHPDLVRTDRIKDDGLLPEPPVRGVVHHFDEMTERGSMGFATLATAEKGRLIFDAAVDGVARELRTIAEGYAMIGHGTEPESMLDAETRDRP